MDALRQRFAATRDLSEREQAGARGALAETLARLAERNRAYEKRFGYIFIVCATGLTAEEILTRLESRLGNEPDLEIGIAAEEQAKITALRLGA
jgi:2-oxo-4-hydroxy-4-carboxy-5-ureidoimidazoline decarboxylase